MSKDKKNDGHQHEAADGASGRPGEKTHLKQSETLHSQQSTKHSQSGPGHDPADIREHNDEGKDRLFEGRQQHDDAEKESERTRLSRDVNKHKHVSDEMNPNREPDVTGK